MSRHAGSGRLRDASTIGGNWQAELRELTPGWDSYNGLPITEHAIKTVEGFYTVPADTGGIQLEVHQDGWDIEIVIGHDGRIESAMMCREAKQ